MITSANELHPYSGSDCLFVVLTAIEQHYTCIQYLTRLLASCSQFPDCKSSTLSVITVSPLSVSSVVTLTRRLTFVRFFFGRIFAHLCLLPSGLCWYTLLLHRTCLGSRPSCPICAMPSECFLPEDRVNASGL